MLFKRCYCRRDFVFGEFEECATVSGDVRDFVSGAEQIDCYQGVTAAGGGEIFAIRGSVNCDFSPSTEVRELEYASRTVPQDGLDVFQDVGRPLRENVVKVQNPLVIFGIVDRFQGCSCDLGELDCGTNVNRSQSIIGAQQTLNSVSQVCFVQRSTDVAALGSNEGVGDTAANDQLVSDFRQGI